MSNLITDDILTALNIVAMEPLDDGTFRLIGKIPEWFLQFYPNAESERESFNLDANFPFLENFLIDAESFWNRNEVEPIKSGCWSETDLSGNEYNLEASALHFNTQKILLLKWLEIDYEEKLFIMQRARENNLVYQKLIKELQKKEILLHCIIHDMAGQLTAIAHVFDLIELVENLTPSGKKYLEIGRDQSHKQRSLIQAILSAFSAEVESLQAFTLDPAYAPDAMVCAAEVINALSPMFSLKNMKLQLEPTIDRTVNWQVVGEKTHLERVLSNLVENAFRHSSPGSTVTVNLQDDGHYILLTVDDEGSGVPPEFAKSLFQKFSQGKVNTGRVGLGLYFCRITIERWGGTIGYSPRPEGGSRFWFRVPKAVSLTNG